MKLKYLHCLRKPMPLRTMCSPWTWLFGTRSKVHPKISVLKSLKDLKNGKMISGKIYRYKYGMRKASSNVNDFTHTCIYTHIHIHTLKHKHTHIHTQCIYLNNPSFLEFLVCQLNTPQLKIRTQAKSL